MTPWQHSPEGEQPKFVTDLETWSELCNISITDGRTEGYKSTDQKCGSLPLPMSWRHICRFGCASLSHRSRSSCYFSSQYGLWSNKVKFSCKSPLHHSGVCVLVVECEKHKLRAKWFVKPWGEVESALKSQAFGVWRHFWHSFQLIVRPSMFTWAVQLRGSVCRVCFDQILYGDWGLLHRVDSSAYVFESFEQGWRHFNWECGDILSLGLRRSTRVCSGAC